jgi:hypothetical protein
VRQRPVAFPSWVVVLALPLIVAGAAVQRFAAGILTAFLLFHAGVARNALTIICGRGTERS